MAGSRRDLPLHQHLPYREQRLTSFRSHDPRRISKIGLLEENFDQLQQSPSVHDPSLASKIGLLDGGRGLHPPPCSILPLVNDSSFTTTASTTSAPDEPSVPLQTLDASVLLRKWSTHSQGTVANNKNNNKNKHQSQESKLSSGGFDNDCFALGCIENSVAGSRTPLVAVDRRTLSSEQVVVSKYCTSSGCSPPRLLLHTNGSDDSVDRHNEVNRTLSIKSHDTTNQHNDGARAVDTSLRDARQTLGSEELRPSSSLPPPAALAVSAPAVADPSSASAGNKALLERVGTPRPRGKLCRGRPCPPPLRAANEVKCNPYSNRTGAGPWSAKANAIRLKLNNLIVNTDFVTDSDSSDDSSSEEIACNESSSSENSGSSCGSGAAPAQPCGSAGSLQKTESAVVTTTKKTECGSEWRNPQQSVSLPRDMVQVGCVSRPPSGLYTNSISVSPRGPYVSNVNTVSVSASVSIRNSALINPVRTAGKVLNAVRGSSSITTTTPAVSALTKVSSVRIVPTPTPTPTPSVTGTSENGSTKLAPPTQRAPFKHTLHESLNAAATARPEPGSSSQLETAAATAGSSLRSSCGPALPPPNHSYQQQHQQPTCSVTATSPSSTSSSSPTTHNSSAKLNTNPNSVQQPVQQEQHSRLHTSQSPSTSGAPLQQQQQLHSSPSERMPQVVHQSQSIPVAQSAASNLTSQSSQNNASQTSTSLPSAQPPVTGGSGSLPPPGPSSSQVTADDDAAQRDIDARREERERRRERRERRRERRAQRLSGALLLPPPPAPTAAQTDLSADNVTTSNPNPPNARLPDLLNSHIPPPYSTLPNGARTHGLLPPPHPPGALPPGPIPPGAPGPLPLHLQHPPPGAPIPPGYPPPPTPGSPIRPPPDCPWPFFGSRRSRGSPRPCLGGEDEGKSCCGMLVTQAVSIRWFIIMIAFVGLCCTVVGTVLGAIKTHNSEYVTITLLMIGVGIVLITVSGVAWHLTSRDAPCRVMLGLAPGVGELPVGRGGESRRFMTRMTPTFGRPHHPYAAMLYPEFQYRPPPPSYQASMQEYRLRLLLLDRANAPHHPPYPPPPPHPALGVASPPPTYRSAHHLRGAANTLGRDSLYSHPPSYRSREGSITQQPDTTNLNPSAGGPLPAPVHSRDPSCLSFLSHDSLYSTNSHESRTRYARNVAADGSISGSGVGIVGGGSGGGGGLCVVNKDLGQVPGEGALIESGGDGKKNHGVVDAGVGNGEVLIASTSTSNTGVNSSSTNTNNNINNNNRKIVSSNNATSGGVSGRRDGNTVTIVQTTDSSQVIGSQSVIVTVSGNETDNAVSRSQRMGVSNQQHQHHRQQHYQQQSPQRHQQQSEENARESEISVLAHL